MKNKEIRENMDKLIQERTEAFEKIEKLQDDCPHENHTVKDYYWRIAASYKAKICDSCDFNIGPEEPWDTDLPDSGVLTTTNDNTDDNEITIDFGVDNDVDDDNSEK